MIVILAHELCKRLLTALHIYFNACLMPRLPVSPSCEIILTTFRRTPVDLITGFSVWIVVHVMIPHAPPDQHAKRTTAVTITDYCGSSDALQIFGSSMLVPVVHHRIQGQSTVDVAEVFGANPVGYIVMRRLQQQRMNIGGVWNLWKTGSGGGLAWFSSFVVFHGCCFDGVD